jgi:hypothetical protein
MNFTHTVMFRTATRFLDYDVSKVVDNVGEFKTSGSTITRADSRHLKNP